MECPCEGTPRQSANDNTKGQINPLIGGYVISCVTLKYFVNGTFERLQVSDGLSFGGYVISTFM